MNRYHVRIFMVLAVMLAMPTASALAQCCGDCNGDSVVTVDEILKAVNHALTSCADDGICSQCGGQRFPATGVTTCWTADGNPVNCSGTGQDGEIQAGGALAYLDNGDGTISDLNTHLMWEKKSADGSLHDWNNTYTWSGALGTFIGGLNAGGGFAGYTDWRLPNVKELQSIVNYQNSDPAVSAAFNTNCTSGCTVTTCSCTQSSYYWSSTPYEGGPSGAWLVYFLDGYVASLFKSNFLSVRAVRAGL